MSRRPCGRPPALHGRGGKTRAPPLFQARWLAVSRSFSVSFSSKPARCSRREPKSMQRGEGEGK